MICHRMVFEHTVKSFEDELKQLDSMIAEMGGMAESQLAAAVDAMVRRDVKAALLIKKADKKIDALESAIDDHAMRILALRQPMANDLRGVIVALKTAAIIERIGDHATNIAENVHYLVHGEIPEEARPKSDASVYVIDSVTDA